VQPIYIPPAELNGAQHGDAVITQVIPRPDGKSVGKILKVTAKAPPARQVSGKIQVDSSNNSFVNDPENSGKKLYKIKKKTYFFKNFYFLFGYERS
jgi:exoribonuclease R